jgi:hypothetical protein
LAIQLFEDRETATRVKTEQYANIFSDERNRPYVFGHRPNVHYELDNGYYRFTFITGIVLKWISLQLGHASLAVTEKHYARYMQMDGYQNPWIVPAGCLPPDLFSELDGVVGSTREVSGTKVAKVPKEQAYSCYPPIWYILLKPKEINELRGSGGVSLCHVVR